MDLAQAFAVFESPAREFGPIPFWFLNDDLEEGELLRQLHAFRDAHYGGFVLHARIGLSRRVGYLTGEFFRLARLLVAEAARLGMKVILYDEGSYPSGSAGGAVVAENPDYVSRAMGLWKRDVEGPFAGFWRPNTGRGLRDRHVCTVLGRRTAAGAVDPDSLRVLEPLPRDIARIEVPAGRWAAMSVWQVDSGGHVRGVFPEEETGSLSAPPAGDILNPEAVACFLRLTHDRYYEHLAEFFGSTIIAMFTDEPQVMGRNPLRPADPRPFTPGLVEWLAERCIQEALYHRTAKRAGPAGHNYRFSANIDPHGAHRRRRVGRVKNRFTVCVGLGAAHAATGCRSVANIPPLV